MPKSEKCLTEEKLDNGKTIGGSRGEVNSSIPSVYRVKNRYYFKITVNGERKNVATGKTTKEEAEKFRDDFLKKEEGKDPRKLATLIKLFTSPETNPRYQEAMITGENYTKRYAGSNFAPRAKHLMGIIPSDILNMKISDVSRRDCERVKNAIFKKYGTRSISNDTFSAFKNILNYAYEKGYIKELITFRMKGIKINLTERIIAPFEKLCETAKNPMYFRSDLEMDKFYVLLTTGLRRAELSALQGKQLKRAKIGDRVIYVLDISQSWKDENQTELGLPKWNVQRIIPLANSTGERLWKYKKGDDEFLMKTSNSVWTDSFAYTKAISGIKEDLSPHKLRHALNTKLVESGLNTVLIQEYFGWHHQDRNRVQMGYTHIYIKALLEVADKIEECVKNNVQNDMVWLD